VFGAFLGMGVGAARACMDVYAMNAMTAASVKRIFFMENADDEKTR